MTAVVKKAKRVTAIIVAADVASVVRYSELFNRWMLAAARAFSNQGVTESRIDA